MTNERIAQVTLRGKKKACRNHLLEDSKRQKIYLCCLTGNSDDSPRRYGVSHEAKHRSKLKRRLSSRVSLQP